MKNEQTINVRVDGDSALRGRQAYSKREADKRGFSEPGYRKNLVFWNGVAMLRGMKFWSLIIAVWVAGMVELRAEESMTNQFASYGELMIVSLDTAEFPHPDRAEGHKYGKEFYSAATNYSDNRVAIFVPKGYRATDKVDFIFHFHGWRNHIEGVLSQFQLIEQFVKSGRNAVLIVPQGPHDAPDSFGGKLEDEGGFARLMGDVMATLQKHGTIHTTNVGDIILSGHSGGYQVISSIVAKGGLSEHVREVWLFDALYARTEKFTNWFNQYGGRRLIDIYTLHGGTREESEKLMAGLKAQSPPVAFLAKNEADVTDEDLAKNRLIFIYSDLQHNEVIYKREEFCNYLKTSVLPPIKSNDGQ